MSSPSPSSSPPSSPASPRPISDEDKPPSQPKPSEPTPPPPPPRNPAFPSREDCWSEEATRTLIDAWGSHYLQLNRGNLRQKHWQEVADAVNAVHATSAKLRRTDVQCKNRIDTTKKKYKIEKSKAIQSNGRYVSTWPHFESLDSLIGDSFSNPNPAAANGHNRNLRRRASHSPEPSPSPPPPPESAPHRRKISPATNHRDTDLVSNPLPRLPWSVPVGPRSKRSGPGSVTERNFSVMAAAAAAMEAEEDDDDYYGDGNDDEDSGAWLRRPPQVGRKRRKGPVGDEQARMADGYRRLAEAISRLGQIYKKVEEAKQQQMVELEKQRMQFAKDLEIQRMKVFMESQVELEKLKRAKGNSEDSNFF